MKTYKLEGGALVEARTDKAAEISYEAWREGGFQLANDAALVLPNDLDVTTIDGELSVFQEIVIEFPHFKDGRAFSQAARLRDQLGFKGVLRARGDVGRDQALFMARVGINAFEIEARQAPGFEEALSEFSVFYQGAVDAAEPVWRLRLKRAIAA